MEATMARNRARTFGDKLTASGTLYKKLTDEDVSALQYKEGGNRPRDLAFEIEPTDRALRRVEAVVELRKPLRIRAAGAEEVNVGTTIFSGLKSPRNVKVRTSISTAGVVVKP